MLLMKLCCSHTNSKASFLKRFQLRDQRPKRNFKKSPAGATPVRHTRGRTRAIPWGQHTPSEKGHFFPPRGCKIFLLVVAKQTSSWLQNRLPVGRFSSKAFSTCSNVAIVKTGTFENKTKLSPLPMV